MFVRRYKPRFTRRTAALAATVLVAGGASAFAFMPALPALAQRAVSINLFRGSIADAGIKLSGWGSGAAESAKEPVLFGQNSIRVTTQGMYQGGRLDFSQPVDLSSAMANKNTFLRFQVKFVGAGATQAGFQGGSGSSGSGGSFGGLEEVQQAASPFKKMRFLLTMADGKRYELVRPIELPPNDDPDGWASISFPLAVLAKQNGGKVPTGDGARLQQLAIFGDTYQQFYIGEVGVITDDTDISVEPLEEQVFFAQQNTVFEGVAQGGASSLKYSWDFDASDGIQEDAVGRVVTHVFPKSFAEGGQKTYTITLTVSDVDGLKKPVSTSIQAEVSD